MKKEAENVHEREERERENKRQGGKRVRGRKCRRKEGEGNIEWRTERGKRNGQREEEERHWNPEHVKSVNENVEREEHSTYINALS